MGKKKFYAVKTGRKPGIYLSWDACKAQITGFSGAVYKGFETEDEARLFLSDSRIEKEPSEDALVAYVDGSYNVATKEFSYGMVLLEAGKVIAKECEKSNDASLAVMRNVAGEIKGAEAAMRYAKEHDRKELVIYHDYEGIAKWCLGEWKANKEGTKAYKAFYDAVSRQIQITFVKVKGHSGDTYNEMADQLAKQALGL